MTTKVKNLKNGVPKLKELKDIERITSLTVNDVDDLQRVFVSAIPELGRRIAKNDYHSNSYVSTVNIASNLDAAIDLIEVPYHHRRGDYAKEAGYENTAWEVTDKCKNTVHADFNDLYEKPQYEVVIRIVAKVKSKEELAKLGVK